MAGGFRELEDITADVGVEAWGDSVEAAFIQAAEGLAAMLADRSSLSGDDSREITIGSSDRHGLLVNFLNEIIFLEETEGFLPKTVKSLILEGDRLAAVIAGETFDPDRHTRNMEIKAATYHDLAIERRGAEVRIRVIFDV